MEYVDCILGTILHYEQYCFQLWNLALYDDGSRQSFVISHRCILHFFFYNNDGSLLDFLDAGPCKIYLPQSIMAFANLEHHLAHFHIQIVLWVIGVHSLQIMDQLYGFIQILDASFLFAAHPLHIVPYPLCYFTMECRLLFHILGTFTHCFKLFFDMDNHLETFLAPVILHKPMSLKKIDQQLLNIYGPWTHLSVVTNLDFNRRRAATMRHGHHVWCSFGRWLKLIRVTHVAHRDEDVRAARFTSATRVLPHVQIRRRCHGHLLLKTVCAPAQSISPRRIILLLLKPKRRHQRLIPICQTTLLQKLILVMFQTVSLRQTILLISRTNLLMTIL